MIRRPPRSTLFPYTTALPIFAALSCQGSRRMWEIVRAGGPLMWPIILCSITGAAIVLERLWTLQDKRSEEHTSELQSQSNLVCRLLLEQTQSKFYVPVV